MSSLHPESDQILTRLRKERIDSFYHFTHVDNLLSISESQALYSKKELLKRGKSSRTGGNDLSHSLDCMHGNNALISLSFTPRIPMFVLRRNKYGASSFCWFVISLEVATWLGVCFTDCNATKTGHRRAQGLEGLDLVHFEYMKRHDPWDARWKNFVQAEVLVPQKIGLDNIYKIVFNDKKSFQAAKSVWKHPARPALEVAPAYFDGSRFDDSSYVFDLYGTPHLALFEEPKRLVQGVVKQMFPSIIIEMEHGYEGYVAQDEIARLKEIDFPLARKQTLDVYIEDVENLKVSIVKAFEEKEWQRMEQSRLDSEILSGAIAFCEEDGLRIHLGLISGFIPNVHLDHSLETNFSTLKGQTLQFMVIGLERERNRVLLSQKRATEELHKQQCKQEWERIEKIYQEKQITSGQVVDCNKGGVIIAIGLIRGFIPASHLSLKNQRAQVHNKNSETRFQPLVGRTLQVKVIDIKHQVDIKRQHNRLVLSEKEAMHELRQHKDAILEELEVGAVRDGVVSSLADFGAFINIGGADGLIHVSELSWSTVNHPSEVLTVGQQVQVKVISVEKERKRIGLSLRQLQPRPWDTLAERYKEGDLVRAVITRIKDFGAFARLVGEPVEGLIHISEMSYERVERADQVVTVGEEYEVKVIRLDTQRRRMGLSIKQAHLDWIEASD